MLNLTELAGALGYSKGRISQLVAAGKLDGTFRGEGRARRFDLGKAAAALNVRLDPGQQTGNGIRHLERRAEMEKPAAAPEAPAVEDSDAKRLARARADAAEIAAREKRRAEQLATGRYVLAEEAARATAAVVAQTVETAERVLVAEAKRLATQLGGDPREAAAEARRRFREARAAQAKAFAAVADEAAPSPAETREMETA